MFRTMTIAMLLSLLLSHAGSAQEWARKMFSVTSHDFGTVARGAKAEFAFELQNKYEEDVHIASVRSSCGCTTPTIEKEWLKTWEKGAIIATYNTHSFLGEKKATITVVIDKPYYAEVQLTVSGMIRSDVVFHPGLVDFGDVSEGTPSEKQINVNYAGRSDWRIVDIRSEYPHVKVNVSPPVRAGGRVSYDLTVELTPDAPAGNVHAELYVITDDQTSRIIPLVMQGRVISALTVSPSSLYLGELEPGQSVTKQLIVRGKKPFRVVSVNCPDGCFGFKVSDEKKQLHFIPVTFTAGEHQGQVKQTIQVETDMGSGICVDCIATASVRPKNAAGE